MYIDKAGAYLSVAPTKGSYLILAYKVKMIQSQTNLLKHYIVNYSCKKFYSSGPILAFRGT
jgi:hypothetical protein